MGSILETSFAGLSPADLLESILQSTTTGFFLLDSRGCVVYMNPACEHITGYNGSEATGKTLHELIHYIYPDGSPHLIQNCPINQTLQSHVPFAQQSSELFFRKDGSSFEALYTLTPLFKENRLTGTLVELRDITPEQKAKKETQESEERFRLLVNGVKEYAIYQVDLQGRVVSWNEGAERIYQYSANEVLGKHFSLFFLPESQQTDEPVQLLQAVKTAGRVETDGRRVRKDRTVFLADVTITTIYDSNNKPIGFANISRDVTERKMVEARHAAILETALDALVTVGNNNTILEWNPAAEKLFGYSHSEAIGKDMRELIIPERYREAHSRGVAQYMATGEGPVLNKLLELPALRADGTEFPAEIYITPMKVCESVVFTASLRDITERKQAEEHLRRYAGKLEQSNKELEQFATIASHDLQEPLRKVRMFSEMLSSKIDPDGKEYLEKITSAISRMQTLIDDLLTLSRIHRQGSTFKKADLNQVVTIALEDLELLVAETHAQVMVEPLAIVEMDEKQVKQVFHNLIGNALKYRQQDRLPIIKIHGKQQGPLYQVFVEDNSIGFNEKYLERIFLPFERLHNKVAYPGTGMGLAIAQKILNRHGGSITASSKEGQGSTFVVTLPIAQT